MSPVAHVSLSLIYVFIQKFVCVMTTSGGVLCREYGSVNSLDKLDCFSTVLRNYRQNIDDDQPAQDCSSDSRRQTAGKSEREKYRAAGGGVGTNLSPKTTVDCPAVFNGLFQLGDDLGTAGSVGVAAKSKSQKSSKDRKVRSESGGHGGHGGSSIFRKLRGVKSDPYSGTDQPDLSLIHI